VTDRSAFSDEQWHALTDAPMAIMLAVGLVGDHGPISMVKESAAGARTITRPPHSGPADLLISQIAPDAEQKEARHDAKEHMSGGTPNVAVDALLADVERAVAALGAIPEEESHQVRQWFYDIGAAVASASKGVKPSEQELLERLAGVLGIAPSSA
jgi:hypothetical protein